MSKGVQIAIAVVTVFAGAAWISTSLSSESGTMTYFANVGAYLDARPTDAAPGTRPSRVHGFVVADSIAKDLPAGHVDFEIHDEMATEMRLSVRLTSIDIPDLFKDGAEVVVEGHYADGRFIAERVMAKCPSKYEAREESEA